MHDLGKKRGMDDCMVNPYPMGMRPMEPKIDYPTLCIDPNLIPELKHVKLGDKLVMTIEVEITSMTENDRYANVDMQVQSAMVESVESESKEEEDTETEEETKDVEPKEAEPKEEGASYKSSGISKRKKIAEMSMREEPEPEAETEQNPADEDTRAKRFNKQIASS